MVDWESAVAGGIPALDLIYFLMYASSFAVGVRDESQVARDLRLT